MVSMPDGPRFVPSRLYETPPLYWPLQARPSTKMSGMSDFVLPNTITIRWYQPQTVRASFALDYMKPPPPFIGAYRGLLRLRRLV